MKTAPPAQPLVRGVWRFVEHGVDARGFKRGRVLPGIAAEAAPAEATEPAEPESQPDEEQA